MLAVVQILAIIVGAAFFVGGWVLIFIIELAVMKHHFGKRP